MSTRLSHSSSRPEDDILARIRRVAAATFQCHAKQFGAATSAADVDGWDSLSHTVFLLELEREFAVRFDISRVAHMANVGELALEIARLMS